MPRICLLLMLFFFISLETVDAFSLRPTITKDKEEYTFEECPSTLRQARLKARKDAAKFTAMHPKGTWSSFFAKNDVRKCSPYIKKIYFDAAKSSFSYKSRSQKRLSRLSPHRFRTMRDR
ncbi:hypothetical protein [Desulfomonile tiedjei]|uniref:Uncharacterized protein n=1 Tax=Desulfomonile tiedjei (strain ATCC 49306 / DSM 6799 / DCB-1) TaxID=706587 RepID=I4C7P6_DESTA|nr:hypothetical protein [Desulfomonile tiedjei]AFM25587.1 hypothetical protein Desti_2918 [Desulfomonile tiedjei DSM 6799]